MSRKQLGVRLAHTRRGTRVELCIGGRPSQPYAWHTVGAVHLETEEARSLLAVLKAGCSLIGNPLVVLAESMMRGKPHHIG